MKVAVCSTGNTLDSPVDPRFGRCAYFVIVDTETMSFSALENPGAMMGGGAGIQAAQAVSASGAEAVVAGNFGPNAYRALSAAGVKIYLAAAGTVRQVVEMLKNGQLQEVGAPTVAAHFGTGAAPGQGLGQGMPPGMGGMGRGGGRGRRRGGW